MLEENYSNIFPACMQTTPILFFHCNTKLTDMELQFITGRLLTHMFYDLSFKLFSTTAFECLSTCGYNIVHWALKFYPYVIAYYVSNNVCA